MIVFPFKIDDDLELRVFTPDDAPLLHELITRNRDHLDAWMRWSGRIQTFDDVQTFINFHADRYAADNGFHVGLWLRGQLIGGIASHGINYDSRKTEIGYWLDAPFVGQGIVTRVCRAVINWLFEHEGLHRIEIQCTTDNLKSRAVAERLGFTFEGVKRESEWITTSFRDHALYSLLSHEWPTDPFVTF